MGVLFQVLLIDRGDVPVMLGTNNPVRDRLTAKEPLMVFLENLVNIAFPVCQADHQLLGAESPQVASSTKTFEPTVTLLLLNGLLLAKMGLTILFVGTGPQMAMPQAQR